MPVLVRLAFVVLHTGGAVFALWTLFLLWQLQFLFKLLVGRSSFVLGPAFSGAFVNTALWLVLLALGLVAAAALVKATRAFLRLIRGESLSDSVLRLRVFLYVVFACIFLGVFVFSTSEATAGPFRVRFPLFLNLLAGLSYGAYLVWDWRLSRGMIRPSRPWRTVDVLCMNLVLALLLGEITLRIVASLVPMSILVTDRSSAQIRRDAERLTAGSLRYGFPVNAGGHYDGEFLPRHELEGPLVVSIGDSFSYGVVPHRYHFTSVAERAHPGVSVYNMGFPGTSPHDYLHLLEGSALGLDPDLVVIQLFVGNDIAQGPAHQTAASWHDADAYLIGIFWNRLKILARHQGDGPVQVDSSAESRQELEELYPWLTDPSLEPAHLGEDIHEGLEFRNAESICVERGDTYERFFAAVEAIVQASRGIPIAFVVIPSEFQVDDELWARIQARSELPLERDLAQRKVVSWLQERELPVLDLLPALRRVEPLEDGGLHLYHFRDTHFNARGNEVAGTELAAFVAPLLEESARASAAYPLPLRLEFREGPPAQWMPRGWHEADGDLAWSDGVESSLVLPIGDEGDVELVVDCLPMEEPGGDPQRILVSVNGSEVGEIELRPGRNQYRLTIPRDQLRHRRDRFSFRYAYTLQPRDVLAGSRDERELAVAWYSLGFADVGTQEARGEP